VKDAEEEEFRAFMAARWPTLVRLAYGLTGDRGLAEDLAQTTLAKVCASWSSVSRAEDQDAYTYRILLNANNGRFRKRRVTEFFAGHAPSAEHVAAERAPVDESAASDQRTVLRAALMDLPPKQRAAVLLRYFGDLSEAQTAAVLGCSVGTIKSQTSAALARLRTSPHLLPEGEAK
jgi:RNA polymerase sigma-70 factor (sigma-E family)